MNHWTEGGHDSASRPPGDLDVILCRLLGRVAEVAAIACGLLSEQGSIIFYKSSGLDQELRQAQPVLNRLGLQVSEVRDVLLPRPANFRRRLLVITRSAG